MSNAQGKPLAIACATALAFAVPPLQAYVRGIDGPGNTRWNTFTADVTIRRSVRDAAGQPLGSEGPPVSYRWERIRSGGRWKSTISTLSGPRPDVVSPTGQPQAIPPVVARIEDDGDGSAPRFYSLQGALLRLPAASDYPGKSPTDSLASAADLAMRPSLPAAIATMPAPSKDDGWIEAVAPSLDKRSVRRDAVQRRFGKALGRLRGHERFVQTVADETTELLLDEAWVVPVEVNIVRGGVLRSHATFVYERGSDHSLVRRRAHAEQVVESQVQGKASRMVLDVELARVQLEERR